MKRKKNKKIGSFTGVVSERGDTTPVLQIWQGKEFLSGKGESRRAKVYSEKVLPS